MTPFSIRCLRFGISPASMSGEITFQSAASQPMSRVLVMERYSLVCLRRRGAKMLAQRHG
jgi:hypothetical protein